MSGTLNSGNSALTFQQKYNYGNGTTLSAPVLLFNATGNTAVTSWSNSGTFIGINGGLDNSGSSFAGNYLDFHLNGSTSVYKVAYDGSISQAIGAKITIPSGSNARQGIATLVAGTVTVSTSSITANSQVYVTGNSLNGSTQVGSLHAENIIAGTGFTINSYKNTGAIETGDTSKVYWFILETA